MAFNKDVIFIDNETKLNAENMNNFMEGINESLDNSETAIKTSANLEAITKDVKNILGYDSIDNYTIAFDESGKILWLNSDTKLSEGAFYTNCPTATKVVLSKNLTDISGAFSNHENVVDVFMYPDNEDALISAFASGSTGVREDGANVYIRKLNRNYLSLTDLQTAVGFPNFDGNIGFEKLDSELQTKLNSLLDLLKYEPINPIEKTNDMTQPVGVDENGQLWVAPIGGGSSGDNTGGGDIPNSHDIIYDLINVNSSSAVVSVADSMPFVTVLTADEGYTLGDVTVTMGGEVLTGVWNAETSTLTIVSVTGDVIISCVATQGIDTSVRIAKSGYGFNSDATEEIVTAPLCISDYYDIPEGYIGKLSYYFPSIGTNAIGGYMKLQMVDDTYTKVEYYSISVSSEGEKSVGFSTSGTVEKGAVKFRFSLEEATVDDAYMYFSGTGDVVFAGKNTPYYRMANIENTAMC